MEILEEGVLHNVWVLNYKPQYLHTHRSACKRTRISPLCNQKLLCGNYGILVEKIINVG
jgi:hypothetical protein